MKVVTSSLIIVSIFIFLSCTSSKIKGRALSPNKESYTLSVGEKIYYSSRVHPSTGKRTRVTAKDTSILKPLESKIKSDNPVNKQKRGGDSGKKTFVFEAIKSGQTSINIIESFQGETIKNYTIDIIVK